MSEAFAELEKLADKPEVWEDTKATKADGTSHKTATVITNPDGLQAKRKPGRPKKVVVIDNSVPSTDNAAVSPEAEKTSETGTEAKTPTSPKPVKVVLTPRQQFVQDALKDAGLTELPVFETLFAGKTVAEKLAIVDIAIFNDRKSNDPLLNEIKAQCKSVNTLHSVADLTVKHAYDIAVQILQAKHLYVLPEVVKTSGTNQAWAGRHRLLALAILYGTDVVVPVHMSAWNENTAKDAAVVANQARRPLTLEKSENAMVQKLHGRNLNADERYAVCVTKKSDYPDYALFCMLCAPEAGQEPTFKIASDVSRAGGVTTTANIKGYMKNALTWGKDTLAKDFNEDLTNSVTFLNAFVAAVEENKMADTKQHLSAKTMAAAGMVFQSLKVTGNNQNLTESAQKLAEAVVKLGAIGTQAADVTFRAVIKDVQ